MKQFLVASCALVLLVLPGRGAAEAANLRDLLLLKQAGLADDILIQLIQSDGSVFHLTADDIVAIRKQGFGENLIRAMLTSAPAVDANAPVDVTAPQVPDAPVEDRATPGADLPEAAQPPGATLQTVDEATDDQSRVLTAGAAVPMRSDASSDSQPQTVIEVVEVPVFIHSSHRSAPPPPPEPVYWGYNGKRRPDAWQDANTSSSSASSPASAPKARSAPAPAPPSPAAPQWTPKPRDPKGGRGGR